jgi:hypothetical protein
MGGENEFRKRDFLRSINSNYTAVDADALLVDASSGAIAITLPEIALAARVIVKKTDASINTVTVATPGSETIDGSASLTISSQNEAYSLISDGENWYTSSYPASSMAIAHVEGTSNFAGSGGATITHNLNLANYIPDVIPTADSGAVGAVWITDVGVNSFVVRNSGSGVSAFTWSVHKR